CSTQDGRIEPPWQRKGRLGTERKEQIRGYARGEINEQPKPQQRQSNVVRKVHRIEVDKCRGDHRPAEDQRSRHGEGKAEAPGDVARQQASDPFHDWIARAYGSSTTRAAAAQ